MAAAVPRRGVVLGLALSLLLLLPFLATVAGAQQSSRLLDAPRAAGTVGERYDGYAVVRGQASADLAALVAKVNAERRAVYAQRAQSEHVPIEAIGKIYAGEILRSAPAGTWFLSETGQWTRK
jgi:hypothetical protein